MRFLRFGCFSCALCALLVFASLPALRAADAPAPAAADTGYGEPAGFVPVPAGLTAGQVQAAILQAALGRGWAVKEKSDGKVVVHHEKGRWTSTLTLLYNETDVRVYSRSFRSGTPRMPDWVRFLKEDVTKDLNRAAAGKK